MYNAYPTIYENFCSFDLWQLTSCEAPMHRARASIGMLWVWIATYGVITQWWILILLTLQYFQLYQNLDEQNQYENTY